jgi:hypothetical protein
MPLVTLTVRKPKSSAFKSTMLNAVHAALVSQLVYRRQTNSNGL